MKHTCPRRREVEREVSPNLDTWESNRWPEGTFPWSWKLCPRTCSFCGSVHPEDVFKLIKQGWEQEKATGKAYKSYLHRPGMLASIKIGLRKIRTEGLEGFKKRPSINDPTPCVKFYTQHFNDEQLAKINEDLYNAH